MRVTVRDQAAEARAWGSPGLFSILTRTVEIGDNCPTCGEPRGETRWVSVREDGDSATVSRWDNPCGHIDYYGVVLAEADRLARQVPPVIALFEENR